MEKSHTATGRGMSAYHPLGIADIVRSYGIDSVRHRIEQLHVTGMHYAATAIERELAATQLAGSQELIPRSA
ncbi:hypothetical protein ACFVUS_26895 [Nocardia sp. NPDC058058]|uniref:hypothetical protein n=1 Tax=Nocardia sp. NPDC058058 TaxID=3346317 RepID=UPI0036DB67A4